MKNLLASCWVVSSLETEQVNNILDWANDMADKYNRSISEIVDAFVNANNVLKNTDEAKQFVEDELRSLKR